MRTALASWVLSGAVGAASGVMEAGGEALLSPSVTRRVIDRMAQQPTPNSPIRAGWLR